MGEPAPKGLEGWIRSEHGHDGLTRSVFSKGAGPWIILIHELPYLTPAVARLGDAFVAAGFSVAMPSLTGRPGGDYSLWRSTVGSWQLCVSKEFREGLTNDGDPQAVHWIRSLARTLGPSAPVGVIGLCFSGGFALAAASDPVVAAAVACEPSLPLLKPGALGVSPAAVTAINARADATAMRVYRFEGDDVAPCERMLGLGAALTGDLEGRCLPDKTANPAYKRWPPHHSVVTNHLIDAPGEATRAAMDQIIAFFQWRLADGERPEGDHAQHRDCVRLGCKRGRKPPSGIPGAKIPLGAA